MNERKTLLSPALIPLIACVLFALAYAVAFLALKQTGFDSFDYVIKRIPSIRLYGMDTANQLRGYAGTWGVFVGAALSIVSLVIAYILYGLFAIIRLTKFRWVSPLVSILVISPLGVYGYLLSATEPRTAIAATVVYFLATPVWYAALAAIILVIALSLLFLRYAAPATAPESK